MKNGAIVLLFISPPELMIHFLCPPHCSMDIATLPCTSDRNARLADSALLGNFRKWSSFAFRAQALGILMGWVVLLSDSAEKHTYIIALAGFMLWYWSRPTRTATDKILFWCCFVLLCIVPIDIFVPVPIRDFITRTLWLHVWVFFIVWIRMIWLTFLASFIHPRATNVLSD